MPFIYLGAVENTHLLSVRESGTKSVRAACVFIIARSTTRESVAVPLSASEC